MARAKDVRLTQVRRIRRRINQRLLKAEREGRLDDVMAEMDRKARAFFKIAARTPKRHRRAAP